MSDELTKREIGVKVTTITPRRKAATSKGTLSSRSKQYEDGFSDYYMSASNTGGTVIQPPLDYFAIEELVTQNNALDQCIDAYEVNIDGTGHSVDLVSDKPELPEVLINIKALFDTPYPGMSMISIRRFIRRELERTGVGYLEVIRDLEGNAVFFNPIESKTMRLVRLDEATQAEVTIIRNGMPVSVTMMKRERRFAQVLGTKLVYFKEYGASRDLDMETGAWSDKGSLPAEKRATEIMYFLVKKDARTPYGVPRWITQMPSVVGSRKAEENNVDYLGAGGIPPAIIFVTGGEVGKGVKTQLTNLVSGRGGTNKNRLAVAELTATGGSIDSTGKVDVKVERFGSERLSDSMFENYDDKCEKRVRSSFRLPPLFVGRTTDFSYATAYASYTVAEAQVFAPERLSFDERMNLFIMSEFKTDSYEFRSLPLNVKDAANQLDGLKLIATTGSVTHKELVTSVNEVTSLNLHVDDTIAEDVIKSQSQAQQPIKDINPQPTVVKSDSMPVEKMAILWSRVIKGTSELSVQRVKKLRADIGTLVGYDKELFSSILSREAYGVSNEDLVDLCQCAIEHVD